MSLILTVAAYLIAAVALYYTLLFGVSFARRGPDGEDPGVAFVIFVPALNEEEVIASTLANLLSLDGERYVICVGDDASTDSTPQILERYSDDPRVIVLRRTQPRARIGKSDVLNDCFATTMRLLASDHPILGGLGADKVIVGIVDADGRLDAEALRAVAPYFGDEGVASVQIGVRIANARSNWLTRMQDIEFVGFSGFVQGARDRTGSVGLGGNGQFTRLSALAELERGRGGPWDTQALTEDLEVGLALTCRGWRNRYCSHVFVAQQGLPQWRALFRQHTRWIQGHCMCWSYLPRLWRARVSLLTRLDLTLYLTLVLTVAVVLFSVVSSVLYTTGVIAPHTEFLSFLPPGRWRNPLSLVLGLGPLGAFIWSYQRHATSPFRVWELPAAAVVFALYSYVWIFGLATALFRIVVGRRNWVKTPRVAELPAASFVAGELPPAKESNVLSAGG